MSDLSRFLEAQNHYYEKALNEIQNGKKESCWMWFVFPQIQGLGQSNTARFFAIKDLQEAKEYLADEVLFCRLMTICQAALDLKSNDAANIFGWPDNKKLQSSMTLFELADPSNRLFEKMLKMFFDGTKDQKTITICSDV